MPERPLLILPRPGPPLPRITIPRPIRTHFRLPSPTEQVRRFTRRFESALEAFIAEDADNVSPENILVLETVGRIEDFRAAAENVPGLSWQGEIDIDEIQSDDVYYQRPKIGPHFFKNVFGLGIADSKVIHKAIDDADLLDDQKCLNEDVEMQVIIDLIPEEYEQHSQEIVAEINIAKTKGLKGRLYLSLSNRQALAQIKTLFDAWEAGQHPPQLSAPWRNLFKHLHEVRVWNVEDRLRDTGIQDYWEKEVEFKRGTNATIIFEAELSYSSDDIDRHARERRIAEFADAEGGSILGSSQIREIRFHAVKIELPVAGVERVLRGEYGSLFNEGSVLFFRPVAQSVNLQYREGELDNIAGVVAPQGDPVVAVLDGLPLSNHELLRDFLIVDDPDNVAAEYNHNEHHHGTAMLSLICHGELDSGGQPLNTRVYVRPILMPSNSPGREESIPQEVFFEDLIERSIRRIKEGEGDAPPVAPSVKVINLSVADPNRTFHHYPSSIARLIDWLSFKYDILFCISSGNYTNDIALGVDRDEFLALSDEGRTALAFESLNRDKRNRRLYAPSESINALTVGAFHSDQSPDVPLGNRIDIIGNQGLPSPVSTLGHGFRSSVKPDIFMAGGRQLYDYIDGGTYRISDAPQAPGQKVAGASVAPGETTRTLYSRGTSNATALTSRGAALLHDVLVELFAESGEDPPESGLAPLLKSLIVHGCSWGESSGLIVSMLGLGGRQMKKEVSRFLGFGFPDIGKVIECTENRATAIGYGSIGKDQRHEYHFPLPPSMSGTDYWRKLTITLAWNTPVNSDNRKYRRAALSYEPKELADKVGTSRTEGDYQQVRNGTVQHEIFEGDDVKAFVDNDSLVIAVQCRQDAGPLDVEVSYGLVVSLEVREGVDVQVYDEVKAAIEIAIQERVAG